MQAHFLAALLLLAVASVAIPSVAAGSGDCDDIDVMCDWNGPDGQICNVYVFLWPGGCLGSSDCWWYPLHPTC